MLGVKRSPSSGNDTVLDSVVEDPTPLECYACTQVGVPAFHSTSCDRANQPEWQASAGSSFFSVKTRSGPSGIKSKFGVGSSSSLLLGPLLDPRSNYVRRWTRVILLARAVSLAVDPLFFYAISVGASGYPCLALDGRVAAIVTAIRTCVDGVHLVHVRLQFRLAYVTRESLVVGCGKLVWDARDIAAHYVRSIKAFWFDMFVILPIPQIMLCYLAPKLVKEERVTLLMDTLLITFLFQYLPKVLHSFILMSKMQKVSGYVFGTVWWGFALNMIAYFLASHAIGGFWYGLGIQRMVSCLAQQCAQTVKCNLTVACSNRVGNPYGFNSTMTSNKSLCLDENGSFPYGIYDFAVPVISSNAFAIKILYPFTWGLYQLSSVGNNLEPTTETVEVIFSILLVIGGLLLFSLLIGNIQVFLQAVMSNKRKMQVRCGDKEWWMRRRQLPSNLRYRVRKFETHRWVTCGAADEMEIVKDLPESIRRDIKRYLFLDHIKKVPIFNCLDDLILDNICDRVKPLIYTKNEKIIREGDPVQQMIFIVRGRIRSSQCLRKGSTATNFVEAGAFFGDELLYWCLRRPFMHRLPASSATFVCIESAEAFGIDAYDLRYVTEHFRYKFTNETMKNNLRYHSSNWKTWAAINIQFAWRRYMSRKRGIANHVISHNGEIDDQNWLRHFAAMFMSLRPHDHLD